MPRPSLQSPAGRGEPPWVDRERGSLRAPGKNNKQGWVFKSGGARGGLTDEAVGESARLQDTERAGGGRGFVPAGSLAERFVAVGGFLDITIDTPSIGCQLPRRT